MDRVKDYDTRQTRTHAGRIAREAGPECRRVLEPGGRNRVIAVDLNPSDVALA